MSGVEPTFELTISLNTLEHLGINLYSNMAAVLSEIVANAHDADAERVDVTWDQVKDRVVIEDDGAGMTPEEVNERFLTVGYRRRSGQPGVTPKHRRSPMGRKGIGKLSLFSIADTVRVETAKDGRKSAFVMRLPDIREKIENEDGGDTTYAPDPHPTDGIDFEHGTRITLTDVRRKQTVATPKALRKRIARRFLVIESEYFRVFINGEEVTVADREYYEKLQYLWTYGDQADVVSRATSVDRHEERSASATPGGVGLTGWLGTVRELNQLKDDETNENLNRIAIFVREKMAQDDVLDDFTERGVFAGYLIGELRADGLDLWDGGPDRDPDAATSSRQRLVEDDPRYVELKEFLAGELKHVQNRWSDWRQESGAKKALEIPEVREWMNALKPATRTKAEKWIGKLNRIDIKDADQQRSLIKQAVLAFEFHRVNENLEALDTVEDAGIPTLLEVFAELDGLEANLYGQIVQGRLGVIRAVEEKVGENALEKVIQEYLFDHMWLIDPAWERAEATEYMERSVGKLFEDVKARLTPEQKAGRIDIGYRKYAGKHVIVELKRPERSVTTYELLEQVGKYRGGLQAILEKMDRGNEPIEIVVLLGRPPSDWDEAGGHGRSDGMMAAQGARIAFYELLMENAHRIYADYLARRGDLDKLQRLMAAIDDFSVDEA